MRININKKLKIAIIFFIVILMCPTIFLLYKEIKVPKYKDENVLLSSCNNKANINYEVFLKPNRLYDEQSIGEGKIYITEFIDYIKTNFNYEFEGDNTANIQGTYDITAEVEGYSGEGDTKISIWKKQFSIVSRESFNVKDKIFSFNKDEELDLQKYTDFSQNVISESKIGTKVKLTVFMNVDLDGNTEYGPIDEELNLEMVIPLNNSYFKITGKLSDDKPVKFEETKQIQLPVNKKKVKLYIITIVGLLVILICIIFITKTIAEIDPLEKELKKIFKDHGDRLVALNSESIFSFKNHNQVKSIEDLVRIADEIGKPIMYKYNDDFKEILKFYVFDQAQMYVLDFTEMQREINEKELKKKKEKSTDDVTEEIMVETESMNTSSQKQENEKGTIDM